MSFSTEECLAGSSLQQLVTVQLLKSIKLIVKNTNTYITGKVFSALSFFQSTDEGYNSYFLIITLLRDYMILSN